MEFYNTYFSEVDWNGNPVKRNRLKYPYSYDAHVIEKRNNNYNNGIYSDRLLHWDFSKHDKLCLKHFGNESQNWDNRDFDNVQMFLRDFFDNQDIELCGIMKGCNVSNGFPYWIFMVNQ